MRPEIGASVGGRRNAVDQHVFGRNDKNLADREDNHRSDQHLDTRRCCKSQIAQEKQHAAQDQSMQRADPLDHPTRGCAGYQHSGRIGADQQGEYFHAPGEILDDVLRQRHRPLPVDGNQQRAATGKEHQPGIAESTDKAPPTADMLLGGIRCTCGNLRHQQEDDYPEHQMNHAGHDEQNVGSRAESQPDHGTDRPAGIDGEVAPRKHLQAQSFRRSIAHHRAGSRLVDGASDRGHDVGKCEGRDGLGKSKASHAEAGEGYGDGQHGSAPEPIRNRSGKRTDHRTKQRPHTDQRTDSGRTEPKVLLQSNRKKRQTHAFGDSDDAGAGDQQEGDHAPGLFGIAVHGHSEHIRRLGQTTDAPRLRIEADRVQWKTLQGIVGQVEN